MERAEKCRIAPGPASELDILLATLRRIWGDQPPAQTLLGVAALALPDMLFEVDAVATRS